MKRLRSYSTDDENSESTSESLSTGLQNGGPTESSQDPSLPEERELDEQSWEMPPRPCRKEKKLRKHMKRILENVSGAGKAENRNKKSKSTLFNDTSK